MKAGLQQSARLGQELKVNPRLYQAMDMLYMPLLDLQQHLKQELMVNPFLELVEPEEEEEENAESGEETAQEAEAQGEAEADQTATPADSDDESQWEEILLNGFDVGGMREEREDREHFEPTTVATRGLDDHLRDQVRLLDLSERDELLADEFIGNINEDGWLAASLDEILTGINAVIEKAAEDAEDEREVPLFTREDAERMLRIIQALDPPGIGARDLHECLVLQLKDAGLEGTLAATLVRDHFPELIAHRWVEIGRKLGVPPGAVQTAADALAKLNPKPGRAHSEGGDNYVVPDLIVEKVEGEYLVFINDANLPRLKLSKSYQEIARDKKKFDAESKEFITSRLSAAQWLVQAIEQRRQTMLKVMHFIVDRQREFFEKGQQALRPLTLREVAEAIGMHESTVSRVTNEKFAQTPRGVLPLKFFFSSALKSSDGEDVSARAIRATIEKLVAEEDPKNPLTDQALVELLERDGVQIARRTVAKYRDQLGVLPARMRKRL
ncbi:MAG: RNA polymerase factor sigma-54 [Gemmatimonadaceae bacterium]|nr:RNA polymerase factor sigma-54 [Gemmatimonadaceae bacterium]